MSRYIPAYGSQTCPMCGYVDKNNRSKDKFLCLHCKHEDHADRVAALNYFRRYRDQTIDRYMPYRQVKEILLEEFHRRLEAGNTVTVPGRTPDTVQGVFPQRFDETIVAIGSGVIRLASGQSESKTKK
jgi:hypothetical protein